jgi:hypothetical protein
MLIKVRRKGNVFTTVKGSRDYIPNWLTMSDYAGNPTHSAKCKTRENNWPKHSMDKFIVHFHMLNPNNLQNLMKTRTWKYNMRLNSSKLQKGMLFQLAHVITLEYPSGISTIKHPDGLLRKITSG